MTDATLLRAATGARILETIANYALAGAPAHTAVAAGEPRILEYHDDSHWWSQVLWDSPHFGTRVTFHTQLLVSEWVARVPGLFWTPGASDLRARGEREPDHRLGEGALFPVAKSSFVSGGVGTIKLPPSESGYRLCTVTVGNVSGGVPALIAPDVWAHHGLAEGTLLRIADGAATWQAMAATWSQHFPSTRNMPRGYLRITDPGVITVEARGYPTEIHPFTIMQYYRGDAELYDFVFATAITGDPTYRTQIETFFQRYREIDDRMGRFLLHADVAHPMWDAVYASPEALERARALVTKRIEDAMLGDNQTEVLLELLRRLGDVPFIRRISHDVGISDAVWFRGGTLASVANDFVQQLPDRSSAARVLDAIRMLRPDFLEETR